MKKRLKMTRPKVFWLVVKPGLWWHLEETKKEAVRFQRFHNKIDKNSVKLLKLKEVPFRNKK